MELKDVERIEALARDARVEMPTSWQGFSMHTANAWTRDYVVALLAAAPELLRAARQGIIAVEEITAASKHATHMAGHQRDYNATSIWTARMVEYDRLLDCITGTPEDREILHRTRARELDT